MSLGFEVTTDELDVIVVEIGPTVIAGDGTGSLKRLIDVAVDGVTHGQVLTFDETSEQWIPSTPAAGGAGAVQWGGITGALTNQTDLQQALDEKADVNASYAKIQSDALYATAEQGVKADSAVQTSDLATVATTGLYGDLAGLPTIPTVPAALSAFANDVGYITIDQVPAGDEIPNLAPVATSGDYSDLTNKPSIPVVPTNVSAFTNDVGYLTEVPAVDVPAALSELTNDVGFITVADIPDFPELPQLADVAVSGDYSDLVNSPTIPTVPTNVSAFVNDVGYLTGLEPTGVTPGSYANATITVDEDGRITLAASGESGDIELTSQDVTNALGYTPYDATNPAGYIDGSALHVVAASGDYNDLANKPHIPVVPTTVSSFINDAGYLVGPISYNDLADHPSIPVVPTNVSAFTNDVGYLTEVPAVDVPAALSELTNDVGFVTESELPTQSAVASSGSYNDLLDKPFVPTAVSQLYNDLGFITSDDLPQQAEQQFVIQFTMPVVEQGRTGYPVVLFAPFPISINAMRRETASGTCTVEVFRRGIAFVTGATATPGSTNSAVAVPIGNRRVAPGECIEIVTSNNDSAKMLAVTLVCTR